MDPKFEKINEIYFRLGIIYKQQMKHEQSLEVKLLVSSKINVENSASATFCKIYHNRYLQQTFGFKLGMFMSFKKR